MRLLLKTDLIADYLKNGTLPHAACRQRDCTLSSKRVAYYEKKERKKGKNSSAKRTCPLRNSARGEYRGIPRVILTFARPIAESRCIIVIASAVVAARRGAAKGAIGT